MWCQCELRQCEGRCCTAAPLTLCWHRHISARVPRLRSPPPGWWMCYLKVRFSGACRIYFKIFYFILTLILSHELPIRFRVLAVFRLSSVLISSLGVIRTEYTQRKIAIWILTNQQLPIALNNLQLYIMQSATVSLLDFKWHVFTKCFTLKYIVSYHSNTFYTT